MATHPIRDMLNPVASSGVRVVRNEKLIQHLLLFTLLLGGTLIYFYLPWLTNRESYYKSDFTYYFQPFTSFMVDEYSHGRLPLWNPYLYCGMAQSAVPSPSMFYPGILFFMVPGMSFSQGISWYMLFHQLVAGIGAFLLIASLGWGALAATLAGLGFALCGFMFALSCNYTLVSTIAWLPLLLYSLRNIDGNFNRQNIGRMIGATLIMFMMVAAGRPELSVPAALLCGAYICTSALNGYLEDRTLRKNLLATMYRLSAMFLGGVLAAPILLPAIEWVKLSPREHGLDLQWVLMWSANWYDFVCMFFAQPMGDLTILGTPYLNLVASRANAIPFLDSTYVGPVILTFALWGFCDRNWRWRWLVLALLVASATMALGNYTPIAPFICKLSSTLSSFRYPVKLMIFPIAALTFAAARGAYLAGELRVGRYSQLTTACVWALAGIVGVVFLLDKDLIQVVHHFPWMTASNFNAALQHKAQLMFGRSFCITAGLGGLVCGNYLLYRYKKMPLEVFSGVNACMLVITLILPAVSYLHHGTVPDFYSRPVKLANMVRPLIGEKPTTAGSTDSRAEPQQAQTGPSFTSRAQTLYFDPLTPGRTFLADNKIDFQKGFFLFARHMMLQNSNVDLHVPYAFGYEAAEVGSYKELFSNALGKSSQNRAHNTAQYESDAPIARFCQMTSVSTVLTQSFMHNIDNKVESLDKEYFTIVKNDPDLNVRIYKTRSYLPRAYFAENIQWESKWPEFFSTVLSSNNKQLLNQTYLEGPKPADMTSLETGPFQDTGSIEFVKDNSQRVELNVQTPHQRLFVMTDHFYPGWVCRVDGVTTPIVRVNFFARGVFLTAGQHKISYQFEPVSVKNGFIISGLILLFLALAWIVAPEPRGIRA